MSRSGSRPDHFNFVEAFGSDLVQSNGRTASTLDIISGKFIGLYFSAKWCSFCCDFTELLVRAYEKYNQAGKAFEVVFVSLDKDEESFKDHFAEMPWLSMPFTSRSNTLVEAFQVEGIPMLVIFDGDGTLITRNGRASVIGDPEGNMFPWRQSDLGTEAFVSGCCMQNIKKGSRACLDLFLKQLRLQKYTDYFTDVLGVEEEKDFCYLYPKYWDTISSHLRPAESGRLKQALPCSSLTKPAERREFENMNQVNTRLDLFFRYHRLEEFLDYFSTELGVPLDEPGMIQYLFEDYSAQILERLKPAQFERLQRALVNTRLDLLFRHHRLDNYISYFNIDLGVPLDEPDVIQYLFEDYSTQIMERLKPARFERLQQALRDAGLDSDTSAIASEKSSTGNDGAGRWNFLKNNVMLFSNEQKDISTLETKSPPESIDRSAEEPSHTGNYSMKVTNKDHSTSFSTQDQLDLCDIFVSDLLGRYGLSEYSDYLNEKFGVSRTDDFEALNTECWDEIKTHFKAVHFARLESVLVKYGIPVGGSAQPSQTDTAHQVFVVPLPAGKSYHAFLSHRKSKPGEGLDDSEQFATLIKTSLCLMGYAVFLDKDDLPIIVEETLKSKVLASCVLIVIVDPKIVESEWCQKEWTWAIENQIPFIPVYNSDAYNLSVSRSSIGKIISQGFQPVCKRQAVKYSGESWGRTLSFKKIAELVSACASNKEM